MKRAFVIGHPIKHSRLPLIHRHWLDRYGVAGSYDAIEVLPEDLPGFFGRLRSGEFTGGNVTLPHKEQAFALCDERDRATEHLGAFNTLSTSGAEGHIVIRGSNTDLYGFLANLDQRAPGWDTGLNEAIVLAARAVAAALDLRARGTVHVLNRSVERAAGLVRDLNGKLQAASLDSFSALAPRAGLVVNTTTLGMHGTRFEGLALDRLPATALVTDIVYTPLETPLLAEARALGLRTADGLGMLLHQAVPGFEAWFGVRPEVTPELRALIEATL